MDIQQTTKVDEHFERGEEASEKPTPTLPPPKGDVYAKPQDILVIFPRTGKMSAVSRKIFNVLAANMQSQVIAFKKKHNDAAMSIDDLFEMPLRDLLNGIETENSNLYELAKVRLKEMAGISIEYESPTDQGSKRNWGVVQLLGQADILHKQGVPYVTWQYPKKIYNALTQSGRYASLNNAIIADLKTYSAVALYEITVKYKTSPGGLTARKEVEWWIDALSETPPKVNKKTGIVQGRDWADFKRRQLKLAIDEINSKTDIAIDLIEHKTGKKVTEAQFTVTRKSNPSIAPKVELSNELKFEATQAGLHNADVLTLIKCGNSEEMMTVCIRKLRDRLADTSQAKIASRINYLRSIVESSGGIVQRRPKVEDKPNQNTGTSSSATTAMQVRASSAVPSDKPSDPAIQILGPAATPDSKALPLTRTYREERFEEMKQLLLEQPKEIQREIANSVYSLMPQFIGRTVLRKLQVGEWVSCTPLFVKMIERFAVQTYGPNWDAEQQPTS